MDHVLRVYEQIQMLGCDVRMDDRPQIVDNVRQMHLGLFDGDLAAFDAAHVEDVVDQREEMLAGDRDLAEVVAHLFAVVEVGSRESGEPDDRVHGRANVMGHVVQECRLGAVGVFRRRQRVGQGVLAFGELRVLLFELQPCRFLLADLFLRHARVAHKQEDHQSRQREDDRAEQSHVIPDHVEQAVGIQRAGIAVRNVLDVVAADHVHAAVQELEEPLVPYLHAEASVVRPGRLTHGQPVITPVFKDIVRPQTVKGGASRRAREHGVQTVVYGWVKHDLRVGEIGADIVILHPVVFIDGELADGIFAELSFEDQLRRGGSDRIGLVEPVFLGIVQTSAHGERRVDRPRVQIRDHIVVFGVSAV